MRWFLVVLLLAAGSPAFGADDDERPPKLLSAQDARSHQLLLLRSRREELAAVSLASVGGMLELGGLAAFLGMIAGGGNLEPQRACPTCPETVNQTSANMLTVAYPAALVMGSLGFVALVAGHRLRNRGARTPASCERVHHLDVIAELALLAKIRTTGRALVAIVQLDLPHDPSRIHFPDA